MSSAQATERLALHGANVIDVQRRFGRFFKLVLRLGNPLVLVLIFAAVLSAATGDIGSCVIIFSIVLLSIVLDSLQENRAETAADRLKSSVALMERVIRDGREVSIGAEALVPGDLVLLAAGDLLPADGRLLGIRDFFVNEALLTGESYPTEKRAVPEGIAGSEMVDAANAAFISSSVVSGTATLIVCATGTHTELRRISATLHRRPPPAALERGTDEFGMMVVRLTMLLVLFVLLVNLALHRPVLDNFSSRSHSRSG